MPLKLSDIREKFTDPSETARQMPAFWPKLVTECAGAASESFGFLRACANAVKFSEAAELRLWLREPNDIAVLRYGQGIRVRVHREMLAHLQCALAAANVEPTPLLSPLPEQVGDALCPSYLRDLVQMFMAASTAQADELDVPAFWRNNLVAATRKVEISVLLAVPGRARGYVGRLSLALVERKELASADGHDIALYPTPLLSLITRDEQFQKAEQDALHYVRTIMSGSLPHNVDIRWDLSLLRGQLLPSRLEGPSLGAAFAIALLQLLGNGQSRRLGEQLVWIAPTAKVDDTGSLSPISEEVSKVLAAVHEVSGVKAVVVAAGQSMEQCGDFVPDLIHKNKLLRRRSGSDPEDLARRQFCIIQAESLTEALELLILYKETSLDRPLPDYGLVDKADVPAHMATDWPDALRTFDLGMVWGLDRGGFIGIASGAEGDGLFASLVRSERALWDALRRNDLARPHTLHEQIPIRYWVRVIELDRHPNGPQSTKQLWDSATPTDCQQIRHLRQMTEPPASLGVFLELNATTVVNTRTVVQWCQQLLRDIFPSQPIAIVIHVSGGDRGQNSEALAVLQAQLRDATRAASAPRYPIQTMAWVGAQRMADAEAADPAAEMEQRRALGKSLWAALCCVIGKANKAEARRGSSDSYSRLPEAYRDLQRRLENPQHILDGSFHDVRSVVRDIDHFYSATTPPGAQPIAWSNETDAQFLSAVRDFCPASLPELIREYARGTRQAGWRQALLLAATSDQLMDAWVQGSALAQDRVTDGMLLPHNGMVTVNALALGILRACRAGQCGWWVPSFPRERAHEVLIQLKHTLSVELQSLVDHLPHHDTPVLPPEVLSALCERYGESLLLLAFRGGMCGEPLPGFLHKLAPTLNTFDFWYYVSQLTPTSALVGELLDAPDVLPGVPARAMIGLVGTQEWQALLRREDSRLLEDLEQCRGGRPLSVFVRESAPSP